MNNIDKDIPAASGVRHKFRNPVLWILISLAVVIIDQVSKYLASVYLQPMGSVPLIRHVLDLTFVTNKGAAFGILSDHRWIYISISFIAMLTMIYILLFYRERTRFIEVAVALMLGGGIGNMIDRLRLGYVVDFLEFPFVNFAIFNLADSCVCVGAALLCVYMIRHELASAKKAKAQTTVEESPADNDEG